MTLVDCPWCGNALTAAELLRMFVRKPSPGDWTVDTCPTCSRPFIVTATEEPPFDVARGAKNPPVVKLEEINP